MHNYFLTKFQFQTHLNLFTLLYRVGKFAFSFPCTVRAPLGVSMALDRAWIVKRKFTQCVVPRVKTSKI